MECTLIGEIIGGDQQRDQECQREKNCPITTDSSMDADKNANKSIIIVGAGLAGSLLAVYLARRGYKVDIFERREDIRNAEKVEGRSINLALSTRGITALEKVGLCGLGRELGLPMYGRIIHAQEENPTLVFQQYGVVATQHLLSISRTMLNERLITEAEEQGRPLVKFHFKHRCLKIDFDRSTLQFLNEETGETVTATAEVILGADGAFSAVRASLQKTPYFNFSQFFLDHAYKELTLPATPEGHFQLAHNGLHIWPRENFMLIGLPNLDQSFTITLFMPVKMFESLKTKEDVRTFFATYFPDALRLMPNVPEQVQTLCSSSPGFVQKLLKSLGRWSFGWHSILPTLQVLSFGSSVSHSTRIEPPF